MTDVGDFPGGLPSYYRVHLEWVRHATETAAEADPDIDGPDHIGPTIVAFDAKFDPIGQRIREVLEPTFMIETPEGLLSLTDRGLAELATDYGTKADTTFGNVSITGTLVVNGAVTFSSTGSFAGPVTFPTNAVTGINPSGLDGIIIDGPAASGAGISGRKVGLLRWRLVLGTNIAEAGSNAGSDFGINTYSDAGTLLGTPVQIFRSTNLVNINAVGAAPYPSAGGAGNISVMLNKLASGNASNIFGTTNGVVRWAINPGDTAAETGTGNAGSNFAINRYSDAGVFLDTPLSISRASGLATFPGAVALSAVAASTKTLYGQTGASNRWAISLGTGGTESGGNFANDFAVARFSDAGAYIDNPLTINRATGAVTFAGPDSYFGSGAAGGYNLWISGAVGTFRTLAGRTGISPRWAIFLGDGTAESGSNAGSDFSINRYTDAGARIDATLSINRASGLITTSGSLTVNGNFITNAINGTTIGANASIAVTTPAGSAASLFLTCTSVRTWQIFTNTNGVFYLWDTTAGASRMQVDTAGTVIINNQLSVTGNISAGQVITASNSLTTPNISMNAAVSSRAITFQTNGSMRWAWQCDTTAEGGSNAGSNFGVNSYDNSGNNLGSVFSIVRATRVVTFAVAIVNGPSDRSLKENVAPLTGSLARVLQLQGVAFDLIGDETKRRQIGFIAQDVAPIVPEILQEYRPDPEQDPKLALDYPKLTALLVEALKEVTARLSAVEAKLPAAA